VADRQSGPLLLRFGNEEQREAILPKITAGECYFSIGMSEPDSGSDLASVRTRAEPVPGGFRVNGTKVWTSGAHRNHYCIALVRTSGQHGDRHKGLSQLLVDLKTPNVTIRPIINLAGRHDWNEVTFSDAFIPESCLIGNEGDGWLQVTSELAFERSGPERFMQNYYILRELVRVLGRQPAKRAAAVLGRIVARLWTLRQMSVAVAGMMQGGKSPAIEASLVKDLGTIYQQDLPEIARVLAESDATTEEDMADFLDVAQYATMMAPSYTIQGGTTQVLRGIVARGLGLR
jgi:alkylation response protein AidB-like acyl-CoA dehydrogenase